MPAKRKTPARRKPPTIAKMRPVILRITDRYGATNVRIFGSFARGEETAKSDVDLLFDPPEHMSLLDHSGLKIDLEEALRMKVDIICARSIKPLLKDRILADARPL